MITRQDNCPACEEHVDHLDVNLAVTAAEQDPDEFCEWIKFTCPNCGADIRCRAKVTFSYVIEMDYADEDDDNP